MKIGDAIRERLRSEPAFFDDANIAFWYWETNAATLAWREAFEATREEGNALAAEIQRRMDSGEINPDSDTVHIIGHSYGGYVGGAAGAAFQGASPEGLRLGQLTGIDVPGALVDADPPIRVNDESFHVVDWYPVLGPGGLVPILSEPLSDTGAPNVINVVLASGVGHSTVLDWYRQHCVAPGNPWTSWVAPKVYPVPRITPVTEWQGSVDYELFAQGWEYEEGRGVRKLGPPSRDSSTAVVFDVPRVTTRGGLPTDLDLEDVYAVAAGNSAAWLRRAHGWWDSELRSVAASVVWEANVAGLEGSAAAHVVYTRQVRVEAPPMDCEADRPAAALVWGALEGVTPETEFFGGGASSAYDVTIDVVHDGVYTESRQLQGRPTPKTSFARLLLFSSPNQDVTDLSVTLDIARAISPDCAEEDACLGHAFAAAGVILMGITAGPTRGYAFSAPLERSLVTAPDTIHLRTALDEPVFLLNQHLRDTGGASWERVYGPDVIIEPGGDEHAWSCFTPSEPGLYVLQATVTSNSDGTSVSVLAKVFVTGNITRGG